jgi:hypothetical protein
MLLQAARLGNRRAVTTNSAAGLPSAAVCD